MGLLITAHHMGGSSSALEIVRACRPPAVKLIEAFGEATTYKALDPRILIIGRKFVESEPNWNELVGRGANPDDIAAAYIRDHLAEHIRANPAIDVWTAPNEPVADPAGMLFHARFSWTFARILRDEYGRRAMLGCFPYGTPELPPVYNGWRDWTVGLSAVIEFGGVLSLHEYGVLDTWQSLRFVQAAREWRAMGFDPQRIPIFIGEAGAEGGAPQGQAGDAPFSSIAGGYINGKYREGWPAAYYADYLAEFDRRARESGLPVIGIAVFTSGRLSADAWRPFDVDGDGQAGLISSLAAYSNARPELPRITPGPVPPPPPSLVGRRIRVRVAGLNLRPGPSTVSGSPLTVILPGSEFTVQEASGVWGRVTKNGWVSCSPAYVDVVG